MNNVSDKKPKATAAEMLAEIKNKELKRVNAKFSTPGNTDDISPGLQKTTQLMDEAERLLMQGDDEAGRDSNLLNTGKPVKDFRAAAG